MLWCRLVNSNYLPVDLAIQSPFDPWGVPASCSSGSGCRPGQRCTADLLIAFFIRSNWWLECVCHEKCDFTWPLFNYSHHKSLLPFICTLRTASWGVRTAGKPSLVTVVYVPLSQMHLSASALEFLLSSRCGNCPTARISAPTRSAGLYQYSLICILINKAGNYRQCLYAD